VRKSLENRAKRLDDALTKAHDLVGEQPPEIPDADELEEMEEEARERLERRLEAVSLTRNADQIREEIVRLGELAQHALEVEEAGVEAKLSHLRQLLQDEGFFEHADQRLLLFTEFKDTLDYLVERLRSWGFEVGFIHGGMKSGTRDDEGTRLYVEQQFKEAKIQILVATEAAGEGINLQSCNILFNYDIPWNPNRLEQRMGGFTATVSSIPTRCSGPKWSSSSSTATWASHPAGIKTAALTGVWFGEHVAPDEVTFDANVFLLKKATAMQLKAPPAPAARVEPGGQRAGTAGEPPRSPDYQQPSRRLSMAQPQLQRAP